MPESATPGAEGAAGTGTQPEGSNGAQPGKEGSTPTFKDDAEKAAHYEARHKEATTALQQREQQIRERESEIETLKKGTAPVKKEGEQPTLPANVLTKDDLAAYDRDKTLESQLARQPNLKPHKAEIDKLIKSGEVSFEEASDIVARRHNIARATTDSRELIPSFGAGGNRDGSGSDNRTPEEIESDRKQGITPEIRQKHAPALAKIWGKAKS